MLKRSAQRGFTIETHEIYAPLSPRFPTYISNSTKVPCKFCSVKVNGKFIHSLPVPSVFPSENCPNACVFQVTVKKFTTPKMRTPYRVNELIQVCRQRRRQWYIVLVHLTMGLETVRPLTRRSSL